MSNFKFYSKSKEFCEAKRIESLVALHFRNKGCIVFKATKEDEFKDIDLYVDGKSYSVKNQQAVLKYGNVAFEEYDNGKASWFIMGKSDFYAICWGKEIRIFNSELLKKRVRSLEKEGKIKRRSIGAKQNKTNFKARNTFNIIVKKEDILDLCEEIIYIP